MVAFVITISIKIVALRAVPNLAESLYLLTDTERGSFLNGILYPMGMDSKLPFLSLLIARERYGWRTPWNVPTFLLGR